MEEEQLLILGRNREDEAAELGGSLRGEFGFQNSPRRKQARTDPQLARLYSPPPHPDSVSTLNSIRTGKSHFLQSRNVMKTPSQVSSPYVLERAQKMAILPRFRLHGNCDPVQKNHPGWVHEALKFAKRSLGTARVSPWPRGSFPVEATWGTVRGLGGGGARGARPVPRALTFPMRRWSRWAASSWPRSQAANCWALGKEMP